MNAWRACLLVGLGGLAGSVLRYLAAVWLYRAEQIASLGTVTANVAGCLVIGLITGAVGQVSWVTPEARLLLATGFCGGFTTMSSFILETHHLVRAGNLAGAALYLGGTLVLCAGAFVLGLWLTTPGQA